jgi:caffeoyl-CoA O-methyltransferase
VPDESTMQTLLPRPVTPVTILAQHLFDLRERAAALAYDEPAFAALLDESARLAAGLEGYVDACTSPESDVRAQLAAETPRHDWARLHADGRTAVALEMEMLSGHVEGQLLNFLVRASKATRILEIGLFTGYSALAMAEALPPGGMLVACEIDAYAASVARSWFDRSAHGEKIRIELGPARQTLERLRDAGNSFDFVFIDADKASYADYLEIVVGSTLLEPHGLVCVDNTLMQGQPYLSQTRTPNGQAIYEFNMLVANDPRIEQVLVPVRDGLTLIRRALP